MEFRETHAGVTFAVKVIPRAGKNEVVGEEGEALKIRLTAAPVEGAANAALLDFLAHRLGVSKSQIALVSGATSRHKRIAVQGRTATEIKAALL